MNDKIYIHEFVEIIGHNRANYMHHMTANWSPMAQEVRNQSCFGVWGTVGTTRRWPEVVNLWEEDGFDGMASSFRHEFNHPTLQDPALAEWWAEAANFRRGGIDKLLVPAPWTRTIDELCTDGIEAEVYAHETFTVAPGTALELLERARATAVDAFDRHGWRLVGAFRTAMTADDEVILLWAIESWEAWSSLEKAVTTDDPVARWYADLIDARTTWVRFLMVDAPLSPMRTGRQPTIDDRDSYQLPTR